MINPIIILEGPDSAGKTTLAEYLATKYGFPYLHGAHLGEASKETYIKYHKDQLKSAILNRDCHDICVVLDRHWPSYVVYNEWEEEIPLAVEASGLYATNFPELDDVPVVYIFCLPDREQVELKYKEDPDHVWSAEERFEHYQRYETIYLAKVGKFPETCFRFDYMKHGTSQTAMDFFIEAVLND